MIMSVLRILCHPFYVIGVHFMQLPYYLRAPRVWLVDFLSLILPISLNDTDTDLTYGELSLLSLISVFTNEESLRGVRTFSDLGGGMAKVCIYLSKFTEISTASWEIQDSLHSRGQFFSRISKSSIALYNRDFLEMDLSSQDCVLVSTTCFSKENEQRLLSKLVSEGKPGLLILSTSLPLIHPEIEPISVRKALYSWGRGHLYLQKKQS
jgi:hypothetical protein